MKTLSAIILTIVVVTVVLFVGVPWIYNLKVGLDNIGNSFTQKISATQP